jgi:hypothetical protein
LPAGPKDRRLHQQNPRLPIALKQGVSYYIYIVFQGPVALDHASPGSMGIPRMKAAIDEVINLLHPVSQLA